MWHIELVKNKYESLEDLYSLLQYVFRLNKTADDSRRANIITDDLTGCLPAMIPDRYHSWESELHWWLREWLFYLLEKRRRTSERYNEDFGRKSRCIFNLWSDGCK